MATKRKREGEEHESPFKRAKSIAADKKELNVSDVERFLHDTKYTEAKTISTCGSNEGGLLILFHDYHDDRGQQILFYKALSTTNIGAAMRVSMRRPKTQV
jgi:hypothetical protein